MYINITCVYVLMHCGLINYLVPIAFPSSLEHKANLFIQVLQKYLAKYTQLQYNNHVHLNVQVKPLGCFDNHAACTKTVSPRLLEWSSLIRWLRVHKPSHQSVSDFFVCHVVQWLRRMSSFELFSFISYWAQTFWFWWFWFRWGWLCDLKRICRISTFSLCTHLIYFWFLYNVI